MSLVRLVFVAVLGAIALPGCSVVHGETMTLADGRRVELTPGMSKREVEALLGRAPYGQDAKVQGAERWVYVNTSARIAWILQFRDDALDWSRQQETTPDWPNASMRR
jgi:outer membrane protein assembly factor BamE (lipoprotein component of BamABCDE complex)